MDDDIAKLRSELSAKLCGGGAETWLDGVAVALDELATELQNADYETCVWIVRAAAAAVRETAKQEHLREEHLAN